MIWRVVRGILADVGEAFVSIVVAVLITVIAVGIEKPIGDQTIDIFRAIGFSPAFLAITNIAGAFCKSARIAPGLEAS